MKKNCTTKFSSSTASTLCLVKKKRKLQAALFDLPETTNIAHVGLNMTSHSFLHAPWSAKTKGAVKKGNYGCVQKISWLCHVISLEQLGNFNWVITKCTNTFFRQSRLHYKGTSDDVTELHILRPVSTALPLFKII